MIIIKLYDNKISSKLAKNIKQKHWYIINNLIEFLFYPLCGLSFSQARSLPGKLYPKNLLKINLL